MVCGVDANLFMPLLGPSVHLENDQHQTKNQRNIIPNPFTKYFPMNCLVLPKLQTLNIKGFAFVEDTKLSINLPELREFKYAVLYPAKYANNKVTDEHETQREKDVLTIEAIKTDLEANCKKLKPDGVTTKIDIVRKFYQRSEFDSRNHDHITRNNQEGRV